MNRKIWTKVYKEQDVVITFLIDGKRDADNYSWWYKDVRELPKKYLKIVKELPIVDYLEIGYLFVCPELLLKISRKEYDKLKAEINDYFDSEN